MFGYDPQQYAFRHFKIVEGQKLSARAGTGRSREIMLGRAAADSLKKRVGDSVKIYNTPYRVVAIFETGVSFEDASGVVSLTEAQRIFAKPHQVGMYGVKLDKPEDADRVRQLILDRVRGVTVSRSADFAENTQDIQVTRAMAWGISVISILAGGIGMMNTVLMSVFERTREIGVLRALGWRRRWVIELILQESLLLSALGAIVGIVLGVGLTKLIGMTPLGGMIPGAFSPGLFIQVFVIALLLGALGGLYPASARPISDRWRRSVMSSTLTRNGTTSTARGTPPPPVFDDERPPRPRWLFAAAIVVLIGLLVGAVVVVPRFAPTQKEQAAIEPTPEPITVNGSVMPVERARLGFSQPGQVVELPVRVGQSVHAGDLLARMDDRELQRGVAHAEAALAVQGAALARANAGPRAEEVRAADAGVEAARAKLDLLLAGSTEADLTQARQALETAQAQQRSAQAALDQLRAGATDCRTAECPKRGGSRASRSPGCPRQADGPRGRPNRRNRDRGAERRRGRSSRRSCR